MDKLKIYVLTMLMLFSLVGCSFGNSDDNSIYLNKKGEVTGTIVEDFAQSYYSEQELEALINQSVSEYNKNEEAVSVDKFSVKDNKAKLVTKYASADDYAKFNGVEFFYGTIKEALDAGYEFENDFISMDDEKVISADIIKSLENYHVVIFEEKLGFKSDKKILFISQNATADGKKKASLSDEAEGLAYLVLE